MLMDTLEELFSTSSQSGGDPKGKKNEAGGFAVSIEEIKILGNLLMGILRYDPRERLSVEAVLEHAWSKR